MLDADNYIIVNDPKDQKWKAGHVSSKDGSSSYVARKSSGNVVGRNMVNLKLNLL